MSENTALVPKGHKRCPGCQGFVKGPRTLVCPHCSHEFGKATPKKPKISASGKPVPKESIITHPPYGDRFGSNVVNVLSDDRYNLKFRAFPITPMNRTAIKMTEYAVALSEPDPVSFPSIVEFA